MRETFITIFGVIIWTIEIIAFIICFRKESPKWLKIFGGIGLFTLILGLTYGLFIMK